MALARIEPTHGLEWSDVVEHSPIPTLLVSVDTTNNARLLGGNRAARALNSAAASLLDFVGEDHRSALIDLLAEAASKGPDDDGLKSAFVDPRGADVQMHVRPVGDDLVVGQILRVDGLAAAEQVLTQQQRFRTALMELSQLAHSTQDDNDFYQRLIERAVEVVPGAQGGSVQLNIPGTAAFRFVAAVGYDLAGLQQHELEQRHFFRDAWDPNARLLHTFENPGRSAEVTEWLMTVGRLAEIQVNVSAPVLSEGFPVAFLSLDNFEDPDAMNETSVEMTTVLSQLIGDLWRRRELEAQLRTEREALRELALRDPLTGLANRRSFGRALEDAIRLGRSVERPSCVLFVDLDDFKGVNDRLGHEVGDQLLTAVARGLEHVVSSDDLVGRWGGDEFLVLPRGLRTSDDALTVASRILENFERDLELGGTVAYRARMSVGIAWSPTSAADADKLIRAADLALYEAKAAGKGLVRLDALSA